MQILYQHATNYCLSQVLAGGLNCQKKMLAHSAILVFVALVGSAVAFAPAALPMGLRQRAATSKVSGYACEYAYPPHS